MLQLTRNKKPSQVVGLDIEAGSVAAAEVRSNGSVRVVGSAIEPLPPGAFHEGEVANPDILAETLKEFFSEHKLAKTVRVGIGNQRVVVRTLRLPAIDDSKELDAAVRFQAQEQIPMPLAEAVLEHQVLGIVPGEEGSAPQMEVVVVAARRDMIAATLAPLRSAGLEPIGIDLSAFGLIRALAGVDLQNGAGAAQPDEATRLPQSEDAILYCNLGDALNLVVARGRGCLFTRVAATGLASIITQLATSTGLTQEHAWQWLTHVGVERPVEEIEGDPKTVADARHALEEGVLGLVDEMRRSLDFYGAQEGAIPVGGIVLSGPGSAIDGVPDQLREQLSLPISVSRPEALSAFDEARAARLTLPYGLALEG